MSSLDRARYGAQPLPYDDYPEEQEAVDCAEQRQQVHPVLGSLIGARHIEIVQQPLDTPESLRDLERFSRAADFVRSWYAGPDLSPVERALAPLYSHMHSVDRITNQFATKIVPCLLQPDGEEAIAQFREVIPNTIDEEMVLLTNDDQLSQLHAALAAHLEGSEADIENAVQKNSKDIAMADRMQFNGKVTRSLEMMLEGGMIITVDPGEEARIAEAAGLAGEGILPITEYVKNAKILNVNGFAGSKLSLAVHDFMDHIWTFEMIERAGLIERYAAMFDSIGNPEATDIFKREGEAVASIAFGVRLFQNMPSAFGPIFRSSKIEEHLDRLMVDGQLEQRHMEAYRTVKGLRKGSLEWQSLGFSFSNYITELDEQRRKYGRIKQRHPKTKRTVGELDPFSPDYLCFFIDTHHQLLSSKNKHLDDLFRFHILLEEYLGSVAKGQIPQNEPLTIKPRELRTIDFAQTTLPPQRIQWMRNNYGFTATRDAII